MEYLFYYRIRLSYRIYTKLLVRHSLLIKQRQIDSYCCNQGGLQSISLSKHTHAHATLLLHFSFLIFLSRHVNIFFSFANALCADSAVIGCSSRGCYNNEHSHLKEQLGTPNIYSTASGAIDDCTATFASYSSSVP